MKGNGPRVRKKSSAVSFTCLLPRPWGLKAAPRPQLSLPLSPCLGLAESPVTLHQGFAHLPYFAITLGQTEVCLSSQLMLLFKNGSKLKKHRGSTVLRGRRKYGGFVTARKSSTKLSPGIIYSPFLKAVFKHPGWFSHSNKTVRPNGAVGSFWISSPGTCRPQASSRWSSLLDSGLVCCLPGSKSTIFKNKCFLWKGCFKVAALRVCFSRKCELFLLSNVF